MMVPSCLATNPFYYYRDLSGALAFYVDVMGLPLVADFGFAKMVQTSPASYLTLMDLSVSAHEPDEPKTVTTAFVTERVEDWFNYLRGRGVPMRYDLTSDSGAAHEGFVSLDPEGYYLEFERFNPHAENERLLPLLSAIDPLITATPNALPVTATVLWLYYRDLPGAQRFWAEDVGQALVVDQGFAKIYAASASGFIGSVRAGEGMHPWTEKKLVTVGLVTDDLAAWREHWQQRPTFNLQTVDFEAVADRVAFFFGSDPEGHLIEFEQFLDHKDNRILITQIMD